MIVHEFKESVAMNYSRGDKCVCKKGRKNFRLDLLRCMSVEGFVVMNFK
jgi:hypothetical protein